MTRNLRTQLADVAERWMRAWAGDDLARESADVLYTYWDLADPQDDELRDEVLSRFPSAEPPSVPGLDWLPGGIITADAKAIVDQVFAGEPGAVVTAAKVNAAAEAVAVLDEPKPMADYFQKYLTVACPSCKAAIGELCHNRDSARWSHINRRNASALPEVTP